MVVSQEGVVVLILDLHLEVQDSNSHSDTKLSGCPVPVTYLFSLTYLIGLFVKTEGEKQQCTLP